jgi:hypothetical protein
MSEEDVEVSLGLLARSASELSEEQQAELGCKLQSSKPFQTVLGEGLRPCVRRVLVNLVRDHSGYGRMRACSMR